VLFRSEGWKDDSRSKAIVKNIRTRSEDWDAHLCKLRRVIIENFEALNELREIVISSSFASMWKTLKISFSWNDVRETQLNLIDELVAHTRIQLKTSYTYSYNVLPSDDESQKKLQEFAEEYFNGIL